jgi:hypothetical protein
VFVSSIIIHACIYDNEEPIFISHYKSTKPNTNAGMQFALWRVESHAQVLGGEPRAGRARIGGEAGIRRFLREAGRTPP